MSPIQLFETFSTMEKHGGGFCNALALAWRKADRANKATIENAFAHLLIQYGPQSPFYGK